MKILLQVLLLLCGLFSSIQTSQASVAFTVSGNQTLEIYFGVPSVVGETATVISSFFADHGPLDPVTSNSGSVQGSVSGLASGFGTFNYTLNPPNPPMLFSLQNMPNGVIPLIGGITEFTLTSSLVPWLGRSTTNACCRERILPELFGMSKTDAKINFAAPAVLRKWPSINHERVSATLGAPSIFGS